ncbi:MAG: restriction endonuclease subunit S [Symploca sp. SIO2D2]|nr:restriction endonuclease subunit S [Symploca sp. SIO2D2]
MRINTKTIDELTEKLIDYRGKTPPKADKGVKLITAKVIKEGRINNTKHEYISEYTYKFWMKRGFPEQWDILITTEAPLGEVAQLRTKEKVALAQRVILLRGNKQLINQSYYFYALRSHLVKDQLYSRANGTTVLGIKQTELRKVKIPYFSLLNQQKIASILSAYDDLIENNNRRIEILEEMARSLYREWFVKFRFPGHEQVKLVDSDLGLIPEGWEVVYLGNVVYFKTGKLNANAAKIDGDYPFFTCSQEILKTNTYSFDTECVLLAGNNANGVFHINYFNGKFDVYQRTYVIRTINESKVTNKFLFFCIRDKLEQLKSLSTGAATKFLTLTILKNLKVFISEEILQSKFSILISPIFQQIEILNQENINLRKQRDLLLPKLISGEIDVEALNIPTR